MKDLPPWWRIRYEDKSHQLWAVSCKLTILLRFESLRRASILSRTACASSSFQRPTPWFLYKTVRCHPERMWRIYYRGEESRYEDKSHQLWAVSCKLNILLRFKSLRQASILNRTTCANSFFWRRVPWSLCKKRYWRWDFIRSNRFFTLCHYSVSHFSRKAFLLPFRITILEKHVTNNGEQKAS